MAQRLVLAAAAMGAAHVARSQTTLLSENFNNGCQTLCLASNHPGWSVAASGTNNGFANQWYVSCAENGEPQGSCGIGCGNDASLHVGNVAGSPASGVCPNGDCGAAYDASNSSVITNRRAQSPVINCTNFQGMVLQFLFIGHGEGTTDTADAMYSSNGGTSWISLTGGAGLKSSCCCSDWDCIFDGCCPPETATCGSDVLGADRQGKWEQRSIALPASANNNANVRIGFNWTNNGNNIGNDPSIAIDDVVVFGCDSTPLPMDLANHLRGGKLPSNVRLDWTAMGSTQPPTTHFHVYRSTSPSAPFATWTQLASHTPPLTAQVFSDPVLASATTYFYDARSADNCERVCPKPMNVSASSDSPSCNGSGLIQFASQISGGQPPFTYNWNFGDFSPAGTTANPSHTYTYPPYSFNVTLTVTDSSLPFSQNGVANLTVKVGPGNLAVTATQNSPKPVNVPVNFTSTPSGGVPPYMFLWDFGDGGSSTQQNPSHAYAASGTYSAKVRVTDSRGCSVTSTPLTVSITPG